MKRKANASYKRTFLCLEEIPKCSLGQGSLVTKNENNGAQT